MRLFATAMICAGLAMSQVPVQSQSTDTQTNTTTKHHGKDVKSKTSSTTMTDNGMGGVSAQNSQTTSTSKKHHGKVKTKTHTTTSGSDTVGH